MIRPAPITETEFMQQVTSLAELRGWQWMHIRPALNQRGDWRTPIAGPLGRGWPDLVLVQRSTGRLIFAELKAPRGQLSDEQQQVLELLALSWCETYVWRPDDWEQITEVLSR